METYEEKATAEVKQLTQHFAYRQSKYFTLALVTLAVAMVLFVLYAAAGWGIWTEMLPVLLLLFGFCAGGLFESGLAAPAIATVRYRQALSDLSPQNVEPETIPHVPNSPLKP